MKKTPLITCLLLLAAFCGWTYYKTTQQPKVAYVRSGELVYGYKGMKEAEEKYQQFAQQMQANADTLQFDFQRAVTTYRNEAAKLSEKERADREQKLGIQEQTLHRYVEAMKERTSGEEERMTTGVLNQINAFVEQYGKENGYTIILGTTTSGNVLYGDPAMDISKEVLAALNADYHGIVPLNDTTAQK